MHERIAYVTFLVNVFHVSFAVIIFSSLLFEACDFGLFLLRPPPTPPLWRRRNYQHNKPCGVDEPPIA